MIKRVVSVLLAVLCLAIGSLASAGSYTDLGRYGLNNLADNQDVVREFNTQKGVIKILFRKVPFNAPTARYRMMLYKDDKVFFDTYWPEQKGKLNLSVFEDTSNARLYLGIVADQRTMVIGFDETKLDVKGYIDSNKLDSKGETAPRLFITRNNDLVLIYTVPNNDKGQTYSFTWNAQIQNFDRVDVSELRRQQEAEAAAAASQSTTSSTGYSGYSGYYTPSYESSYEEPPYVDFGGDVVDF